MSIEDRARKIVEWHRALIALTGKPDTGQLDDVLAGEIALAILIHARR